mgnify:CR=1 FL=1
MIPYGLKALMVSGDVGVSSLTLAATLSGEHWILRGERAGGPSDDDDFGRCFRMLEAVPEWRERIAELGEVYPATWGDVVGVWPELEALWVRREYRALSERMHALLWTCHGCQQVVCGLTYRTGTVRLCYACDKARGLPEPLTDAERSPSLPGRPA